MRWRSRRGMRELDLILMRYLDQAWPVADATERGVYERLLDTDDTLLWPWLMGRERPDDADFDTLVQKIRSLPVRQG